MAKTISMADDVYEWMKKKKGERSFSELIRDLSGRSDLKELEGIGFTREWEKIEEAVKEAPSSSEGQGRGSSLVSCDS